MRDPQVTVSVARSPKELQTIRSFWAELNQHPETDIDFVLMLASERTQVISPHVVVAHEDDKPIALLVGRAEHTRISLRLGYSKLIEIGLRQLVFVRDGFLGERSERVASAMIENISNSLRGCADRVLFSNVPTTSPLVESSRGCSVFRRSLFNPTLDHWITQLPPDYEEFLKRRPKKHRYWLRRIGRVFESQAGGAVRYEIADSPESVSRFCSAAEAVARKTYQRGLGAGFVYNDENRKRLLLAAERGWLRGHIVFVDEIPVAFWSAEQVGAVAYLIWTGYDPAYRKFEVGTVLFLRMLADLLTRGCTMIDYGLGGAMYKERFGDVCSQELDLAIYAPTPKAFSVNLAIALSEALNTEGKRFLSRIKLKERIKRLWRSDLASHASKLSDRTPEVGGADA